MDMIARVRQEIERLREIGGIVPFDNQEQKTSYESALINIETFLDTLESENPVPNDLEEAVWDCVLDSVDVNNPVLLPKYKELLTYLFIAGAKWNREQMLKDVMDGEYDSYPSAIYFETPIQGIKHGDKVRIIIVKEDISHGNS